MPQFLDWVRCVVSVLHCTFYSLVVKCAYFRMVVGVPSFKLYDDGPHKQHRNSPYVEVLKPEIYIVIRFQPVEIVIYMTSGTYRCLNSQWWGAIQKPYPLFVLLFDHAAGVEQTVEGPCLQQGNRSSFSFTFVRPQSSPIYRLKIISTLFR